MRHDFDREAAFEELLLVEIVHGGRLGRRERVIEPTVFLFGQRTVQVVALAIVDAAGNFRRA